MVALLVAGTACRPSSADKGATGPTATVATEPAPTTTTDPYAVPTVIDAAYVNRVLAGLDAQIGDVTRMVIQTKTIPPEAYDRIRAVYADAEFLQLTIDNYQSDIRRNFAGYKPVPGNEVTTVTELITTRPTCVFARVKRDYSSVATTPSSSEPLWVALKPLNTQQDPHKYNSTSWALTYDGFSPGRTPPSNPCAA